MQLAETLLPPTPAKLWGARDVGRELLKVGTDARPRGPVTEVVTTRRAARSAAGDDHAGRRTADRSSRCRWSTREHPDGRGHNLGMYRLHVHDARTTGMHWQIGKGGGFHYAVAEARDQALPVTVFLGGPPALILAAIAPLPENVPELMLASLIAGERLTLVARAVAASAGRRAPSSR